MVLWVSMSAALVFGIVITIYLIRRQGSEKTRLKTEIATLNQKIIAENKLLQKQKDDLIKTKTEALSSLDSQIISKRQELEEFIKFNSALTEKNIQETEQAFQNYLETLEEAYAEIEDNFDSSLAVIQADIDKFKATQQAQIKAKLREKELQEKENYYKMSFPKNELQDIEYLDELKLKLSKPEILCKLIWSTYVKPKADVLCNNIVGDNKKAGVYKITDTLTGLAYIGQSVDLSKRIKEHLRAALGATPAANNKLYNQMRESGLQNFTFEILEDGIPASQLNEKEKFYIELYQTSVYGLNATKGNRQ